MIPPSESLLKYDTPVLVTKRPGATSPKGRSFVVSSIQSHNGSPVSPPPKATASSLELENVLSSFLAPREWAEGTKLWVQNVSRAASTRADVIQLTEKLDEMLKEKQAKLAGICPIRREIYSQCFDELIRQVTINCDKRGSLLIKVREEINLTIAAYQTLHESSVAFGMRKALLSEQGKADMERTVIEMEKEKQDLIKQINEEKAKCEEIEKREAERRPVEEKKFLEEINFLKMTNQQLKTQLESIIASKN